MFLFVIQMPSNANVFVHHGPYEACALVDHKTHRLEGLQTVLQRGGHKVTLVPSQDWNVIEVVVNGETVFTCDIRDLDFGGDGQLDELCSEALQKVNRSF